MKENVVPRFVTIREAARLGVLSEHRLRMLEKQSKLPCIYAGRKCLVNLDILIERLNEASTKGGE